jgi:uncharacterized membrane protein
MQRCCRSAKSMDAFHTVIDVGASAVEAMGVLLILCAFLWASISFVVHAREQVGHRYERYKLALGRALSLGLEFLVAADVIKTVTTAPTFTNIGVLAAVIVTRTFLSWSLAVEMEGRWPWQQAAVDTPEVTV